jgi:outer membrane receptor protein involved in Fe transport
MKNTLLTVIAPLAFQAAAMAASGVSVHLTDPQQKPIAGAVVTLTSRSAERWTATTDAAGACAFSFTAAGQYFVEAVAPGFDTATPQTINVQPGAATEVSIALGIAAVRSSVVVTASGTPQSADEVSKSLTVVDSDATTLRVDRSLGEALVDVPGIRVQQLGGPLSTTYFKIRGLRNTDTAVLVDGLRLRDAAGTQADASGVLQDLVLTDTARIEVLRGAGSSLYGTDATGGVINIVTEEGGGRTRGALSIDGGALGSVRGTAHLAGGLFHDRVQYSTGLTHWNVTRGVDDDSPARNTSGQGQVTIRLSPIAWISGRVYVGDTFGFVQISPRAVGTLPSTGIVNAAALPLWQEHLYESGTPISKLAVGSATFLPAAFDPDSTRAGSFFTGALRFTVQPSSRLGFTAQYQDLHTTRDYGNGPAGPGSQPAGNSLSQYIGRIQTANARVDSALGRNHHFDAGYEFEDEDFRNGLQPPPPTPNFYSNISQRSNAIFAQDQIRVADGRLQFAAGYRAQFFSLSQPFFQPSAGSPFGGKTFTAPPTAQTGDLSAAYTFRRLGTKIRTHGGRGYRAPSLYERFGTFFSGTSYTLYGDPGLRPDRSSSIDGGIDQMLWNSRVQLSATYFYTRLNEVIIFDSSGVINQFTDPLGRNGGYRNTGGGLARGVEFRSDLAATRSLQLTTAYTYADARQAMPLVPGVWQTYEIPRHQYSVFATERFTSRLTAYFGYAGSTSYLDPVSSRAFRFPGPSRAQTAISYRRPLREFSAVRLYLKADNLFNQTYFENGYRTPGIGVTGGTQWEF